MSAPRQCSPSILRAAAALLSIPLLLRDWAA